MLAEPVAAGSCFAQGKAKGKHFIIPYGAFLSLVYLECSFLLFGIFCGRSLVQIWVDIQCRQFVTRCFSFFIPCPTTVSFRLSVRYVQQVYRCDTTRIGAVTLGSRIRRKKSRIPLILIYSTIKKPFEDLSFVEESWFFVLVYSLCSFRYTLWELAHASKVPSLAILITERIRPVGKRGHSRRIESMLPSQVQQTCSSTSRSMYIHWPSQFLDSNVVRKVAWHCGNLTERYLYRFLGESCPHWQSKKI